MKRLFSTILSLVMIFSFSTVVSSLESPPDDIDAIAEKTISITTEQQDNGVQIFTFNNIPEFVSKVRNNVPEMTDLEISDYLISYIYQGETNSSLFPTNDRLALLDYESISNSTSYVKYSADGNFEEVDRNEVLFALLGNDTSTDGYMQLETSFAKRDTVGSLKYFPVWTFATWLKWPALASTDVLVLSSTGTFDDSQFESGLVNQTFRCASTSGCSQPTYRNRTVSRDHRVDGDLTLKYSSYTPYLEFDMLSPHCDYCGSGARDDYFKAYIRYGVTTSDTCNIQASYGHTTLGLGSINVDISASGNVSISAGAHTQLKVYTGRAVTLK